MPNGTKGRRLKKAWSGRVKTIASQAKEFAEEAFSLRKQEEEAAQARTIESERGSLWSLLGTGACLAFGGGPICLPVGQAVGKVAKGVGTWKGKDIEDFKIDESDVGRWNKTKDKAYREDINTALEQYDTNEFWSSVKDFGMSLLSAYQYGGGIGPEGLTPGNWSPTKWGGKGGMTTGETVGSFFGKDTDYSNYQFGEASDWNLGYVGDPVEEVVEEPISNFKPASWPQ